MATIVGDKVKLNNGQLIAPNQGGWYDGQQYWGGTLSQPGQINPQSNQQGAGEQVSREVVAQTNPANVGYIEQQRKAQGASTPQSGYSTAPTSGSASGSGTGATGASLTPAPTIDLTKIYQGLYDTSGVKGKQDQLSQMEREYIEATGKINDNPFLSEATRVGRIAKLDELFQKRTANIRGDIATSKADIETQLNLQMKQFDINSQAAQQAMQQFQTLLSSGALDNATGDDIAGITRSTGLSSSMIYSAIDANKKKNTEVSTIEYDDGVNKGYAIINKNTGEIINKQPLGASTIKTSSGSGTSSGSSSTTTKAVVTSARSAITKVDTNKDKALSLSEFQKAIQNIMTSAGVTEEAATQAAAQAMADLGYKTWKWNT